MPGQVLAYIRVSSADQNPERQVTAIHEALGGKRDRCFTDHASGVSTDRPALTSMLAHVRDEDVLVVASMDRLARSVIDLDQLVTRLTSEGVTVRFLKEGLTFQPAVLADPLAVFQLQVMGAFAQLERALIRDRQREGIAAAKARGVYRGRARRLGVEQVEQARADIEAGVPKAVVARRLGVARQTLYTALHPDPASTSTAS
ncbi:recombinase family protein [Humibacillus xanthopallidus]|uniref:DNA invertase Pin-like site-specific DNA recombinase n=1 Tax=Humibacillus xanthopallidus TaxID=412689 RepID=A0A543HHL7_9MICO|nr:recombinase family protein [Humibacillus xanthopallidus]TQM57822.1 DNA invertase Pin-like site-specific DNA recombinase [Humibacillus xanthopallidus]